MRRIFLIFALLFVITALAQDKTFTNKALKKTTGFGANEIGFGFVFGVGYQWTSIKNERFRFNPTMLKGNFSTKGIMDAPDIMQRITNLEFRMYYDVIKYKSISLFLATGAYAEYNRGLHAGGGDPESGNTSKKGFFTDAFAGGLAGVGFRIDNKTKPIAFEIIPITLHRSYKLTNSEVNPSTYNYGYFQIGIDIKFDKK